jgi:cation-transporting P-type ATPase I
MKVPVPGLFLGPWSMIEQGADLASSAVRRGLDLLGDMRDDVEEVVEEGEHLVEDTLGLHRRVWEDTEHHHAQIEASAICEPDNVSFRQRLKQSLERLDGVRWAEINAVTSRVAVSFDESTTPLSSVIAVIEAAEVTYGIRRGRADDAQARPWDAPDRADHPSDIEPIHRAVAALVGDALGLTWSMAAKVVPLPRLLVESSSIFSLLENTPWLRSQAERVLGRRVTALALPLANAAVSGVTRGAWSIVVDVAYRATLLGELHARREVWERREPEFYANPSAQPIEPPDLDPRPVPLPSGPVEIWSARIALGSLVGFAAILAATRDPRRAADAFLAGIPKAARLGREGFAAQLGRTLAARGVLPLDASALRRLDRINTVVIDSDALVRRSGDGDGGRPLLDPAAGILADAVRRAGHRLVIAGRKGNVGTFLRADAVIPRGKWLGRAIRDLQAEGAVVAALGRRGKTGLAAADVGIGLVRQNGRPPWGADLVCGQELVEAAFLIDATAVAAQVSRRSAYLALIGSTLGAVAAAAGPRHGSGERCLAMVNSAAAVALAAGTWSGIDLAGRPAPFLPEPEARPLLPWPMQPPETEAALASL